MKKIILSLTVLATLFCSCSKSKGVSPATIVGSSNNNPTNNPNVISTHTCKIKDIRYNYVAELNVGWVWEYYGIIESTKTFQATLSEAQTECSDLSGTTKSTWQEDIVTTTLSN